MSTLARVTATRTETNAPGLGQGAVAVLAAFRHELYGCLTACADELTEAVLCTGGPVKTLVDLALAPEHRRWHGALYDGLNRPDRDRPAAPGAGEVTAPAGGRRPDRTRSRRVTMVAA
ncbi:hypothetical protein ACWDRB_65525 [Nonomuraea sp. NPDC003707]